MGGGIVLEGVRSRPSAGIEVDDCTSHRYPESALILGLFNSQKFSKSLGSMEQYKPWMSFQRERLDLCGSDVGHQQLLCRKVWHFEGLNEEAMSNYNNLTSD